MTNDIALRPDGPVSRAALEAWLDGGLSVDQADELRSWVRQPSPWREAYGAFLRELATNAVVPRFDAAQTISVAADDSELEHARVIDWLPLPHLGPNAVREGRLTEAGTTWRVVGAERDVPAAHLPYGETRLAWNDPDLGVIETDLREVAMTPLQRSQDALSSLVRLADGLQHPRASDTALEAARELGAGSLRDGLAMAREAFVEAKLDDAEEVAWAVCAFETQLALDRLAHRLCNPQLDALLLDADRALGLLGEALMLLEDDHYAELVEERGVDETAWWGFRARLDARVPETRLEAGLDGLRQEQEPEYAEVVQLIDRRTNAEEAPAQRPRLRAVAAASEPGMAFVLVAIDAPGQPEHGQGRVVRVTVKRDGGGQPFAQCPWFGPVAKEAIRDAYQAAADRCADGVAPYPLEEHTILVDAPGPIEVVDGSSLGLAFALAFASAWTDTPLPSDVVATGRLVNSAAGWMVTPVDHVAAKTLAARVDLGEDVTVLVAKDVEADVRRGGLAPRAVGTVAEAFDAAELDVTEIAGAWPDNDARAETLKTLIRHVGRQDVARYAGFGNPWLVAARRMQTLVEALCGKKAHTELVETTRTQIVLAYVHAGELGDAARALKGAAVEGKSVEVQIAANTAELNATIDRENWAGCDELRRALDDLLAQVPEGEHADLVGQALGTLGRARLHAREFNAAEVFLARAVEHHDQHAPEQSGRSRVYLAQAQRNLGRTDDALATLQRAEQDLETHTRPDSRPYFRSCRMYLQYERARVFATLGDGDAALSNARDALASSRYLGFWPQLGILRTTAWAYRLLGEHDRADACVEQMQAFEVPKLIENLRDRLVDEGEGFPSSGGEVY